MLYSRSVNASLTSDIFDEQGLTLTNITDVCIVSVAGLIRHSVVVFPVHDTTVLNTAYIIRLIPGPQGKITCT